MSDDARSHAVQREYDKVEKELSKLQNKLVRLKLLRELQQKGATRPETTWFVAGNSE